MLKKILTPQILSAANIEAYKQGFREGLAGMPWDTCIDAESENSPYVMGLDDGVKAVKDGWTTVFFDNKKELTQTDEIALLQLTRDFLNRSESNA